MSWSKEKEEAARLIMRMLYDNGMIRTFYRDRPQGWTLISGLYSPLYIQLRPMVSYPDILRTVCRAMVRMIREEAPEITKIVGIAMAGIPIVAGMAVVGGMPAAFTRKMEGVRSVESFRSTIIDYGEHSLLEGDLVPGDKLVLVDDLVTRFDSKQVALEQVNYEIRKRALRGVERRNIAVVLDREQGGQEAAQATGMKLVSLIPFKTVGLPLLKNVMAQKEWEIITSYLDNPSSFQDLKVQEAIAKESIRFSGQ